MKRWLCAYHLQRLAYAVLQAFTCEACTSLRPSSNSAAAQDDGTTINSNTHGQQDTRQEADKGKKKGKTAKFERLRITGIAPSAPAVKTADLTNCALRALSG